MSNQKRKYEMRRRAERQAETRRRIAAATAALHEEVGPARTTVAEIARRAGVQRLTVYNNFPADRELFAACQGHFLAEHPVPDLTPALAQRDPVARVRAVLELFYGWYADNERMSVNIRRDRGSLPALDELMRDTTDARMALLADELTRAFGARGHRRRRLRAAIALALDLWTWHRLRREGLADADAATLMADAVRAAA